MNLRRLILDLFIRMMICLIKLNYRPISILLVLSKAFERCLYDQIYEYSDNVLLNVASEKISVRSIH